MPGRLSARRPRRPLLARLSTIGPPDTRRALISYASEVETRLPPTPGGDLVAALGGQRDYSGRIGASLIAGVDEAFRILAEQQVDRRMLVIIGSGQAMREDVSADVRRAVKRFDELDAAIVSVGYSPWPQDSPIGQAVFKKLGVTEAYWTDSRDQLEGRAKDIAGRLDGEYLVTFELSPKMAQREFWTELYVRGDERDPSLLTVVGETPERVSGGEPRDAAAAEVPAVAADGSAELPAREVIPRVVQVKAANGASIITINRGKSHGVERGHRATLLHGESDEPLAGGSFVIIKVLARTSIGKVNLSIDQVRANSRVRLENDAAKKKAPKKIRPTATRDEQSPTQQAAEPAEVGLTYEELVAQARAAAMAGQYGKGLRLCRAALAKRQGAEATVVCALCACNLKNASLARRFVSRLQGSRQRMARSICLRNGVQID